MATQSERQNEFCRQYLVDLNATQAAIRADYNFPSSSSGYYVYFLVNPINGNIFYVGKGKGKRKDMHLLNHFSRNFDNTRKHATIASILAARQNPLAVVFESGLSEAQAFDLERQLINNLNAPCLTNAAPGVKSENEAAKERAMLNLSRIMPFEKWVSIRSRTECEKSMYQRIVNEFKKIAEYGVTVDKQLINS
ncbi:MAG TPA: terminase small subunit [Chitinophagales bacterium]|nr:terminase small subunit [Chitinophagales bacterium]